MRKRIFKKKNIAQNIALHFVFLSLRVFLFSIFIMRKITMTKKFEGQTAIITGGARGIGLGTAQKLASRGVKIIIWDRTFDGFDATRAGFSPLLKQVVDVSDLDEVARAFDIAEKQSGSIDILVNSAGITGPMATSWDYPLDAWTKVLAVNLNGVYFCCRAAIPSMRARGYGRIVNIASMAGKEPSVGIIAYGCAKSGVISLTKTLGRELAESGVTVNAVAPALTRTDLFEQMTPEHIADRKATIPMKRFIEIEDVANVITFIASPECAATTGFVFDVSGGRAVY